MKPTTLLLICCTLVFGCKSVKTAGKIAMSAADMHFIKLVTTDPSIEAQHIEDVKEHFSEIVIGWATSPQGIAVIIAIAGMFGVNLAHKRGHKIGFIKGKNGGGKKE